MTQTQTQDLILFVEDNADFRDSAARFLELSNFEVLVASDGREALEILENSTRLPDVIISDISMPNMNGYELFEEVRNRTELTSIPFIFLTALDARDDFKLGWDVGVDEYLVKPFRPEDFLAVIQNRLRRYRDIKLHAEKQLHDTRNMIVRILSHELRTPLTYVTGGFTLLADEINKGEQEEIAIDRDEIQTILHLIHSGTDRLNRLAEQMVMLAELMSTQSVQAWDHLVSPLRVPELVENSIANLTDLVQERQVNITTDLQSVSLQGIRNLLIAAISEPLRNALQFNSQNVHIRCYADDSTDDFTIIEIVDDGRGIPQDDLENIWKLMEQSQRDKYEQQGFGLGLPITQRIAELHRGKVRIDSTPDVGTSIWLYFPAAH